MNDNSIAFTAKDTGLELTPRPGMRILYFPRTFTIQTFTHVFAVAIYSKWEQEEEASFVTYIWQLYFGVTAPVLRHHLSHLHFHHPFPAH